MTLVPVDVPAPPVLAQRWAVEAAVDAAVGLDGFTRCAGDHLDWSSGGGSWCRLTLVAGDRAVLTGNDRDYSRTGFRAPGGTPETWTDLLAGAPAFWDVPLAAEHAHGTGFIYGYEDGRWQRVAYDTEDGFAGLGLPMASETNLTAAVLDAYDCFAGEHEYERPADPDDIERLAAAGAGLTEQHLVRLFTGLPVDATAGVRAARTFLPLIDRLGRPSVPPRAAEPERRSWRQRIFGR